MNRELTKISHTFLLKSRVKLYIHKVSFYIVSLIKLYLYIDN